MLPCASKSCKEGEAANEPSNANVRYYFLPGTPPFHGAIPPEWFDCPSAPTIDTSPAIPAVDATISSNLEGNRIRLVKLFSGFRDMRKASRTISTVCH